MPNPTFDLAGKAILVTGANSGIGRQISLTLARHGAHIAVGYFDEHKRLPQFQHSAPGSGEAQEVVREILALGRDAVALAGDLSCPETPADLIQRAENALGPLHGVINNAAHCELPDDLRSATWDVYRRHFDVNVGAAAMMMAEFSRRYAAREQRSGRIVNISTDAARAFPGQIFYGASKAALEALTRAAAIELGPQGITVNAIAPGPVQTGYIDDALAEAVMPTIPLRRLGTPGDIADFAAFLMSDAASWITGQVVQVAGGHAL